MRPYHVKLQARVLTDAGTIYTHSFDTVSSAIEKNLNELKKHGVVTSYALIDNTAHAEAMIAEYAKPNRHWTGD